MQASASVAAWASARTTATEEEDENFVIKFKFKRRSGASSTGNNSTIATTKESRQWSEHDSTEQQLAQDNPSKRTLERSWSSKAKNGEETNCETRSETCRQSLQASTRDRGAQGKNEFK